MDPQIADSGNRGGGINAMLIVLTVVSVACVSSRTYVRLRITKSFGWDDAFLLLATAQAIMLLAFGVLATSNGLGQHKNALTPEQVSQVIRWNTAFQIDNVLGLNWIKTSILILVLRIQNNKTFRDVIWGVLVVMTLANLQCIFYFGFQCWPLEHLWDPNVPGACASVRTNDIVGYVQSAFSIATDLFCSISPIVLLWNVQIRLAKKFAVCGLMSIGLAATICNGLRNLYYGDLHVADYTYSVIPILIVTSMEFYLALIAACLPIIVPAFSRSTLWLSCVERMSSSWSSIVGKSFGSSRKGSTGASTLESSSSSKRSFAQKFPLSSRGGSTYVDAERGDSVVPMQQMV